MIGQRVRHLKEKARSRVDWLSLSTESVLRLKKKKKVTDQTVLGLFICSWICSSVQGVFLTRVGWRGRYWSESSRQCPQLTLLWGTRYPVCFDESSVDTSGCSSHSDPRTHQVPRLGTWGPLPDKCLWNWKFSRNWTKAALSGLFLWSQATPCQLPRVLSPDTFYKGLT